MITDRISLAPETKARMARKMSHWVNVAQELYGLIDETRILTMLKVELETKNRYYIVQRIFAHYNAVRRRRELSELKAWRVLNGVGKEDREIPKDAD